MGYLKTLTQSNGVTGDYWNVYSIDLIRESTRELIVSMGNYVDQASADANPQNPLALKQINLSGVNYPDISVELSNLKAKIYPGIDALPVPEDSNQPADNDIYFSDAVSDVSPTITPVTLTTEKVVQ